MMDPDGRGQTFSCRPQRLAHMSSHVLKRGVIVGPSGRPTHHGTTPSHLRAVSLPQFEVVQQQTLLEHGMFKY